MSKESIQLSDLACHKESAVARLRADLRCRGFACVRVDIAHLSQALNAAIEEAAHLEGFRFPPIDGPAEYTTVRRGAFKSLFHVGILCLEGLLSGQIIPSDLSEALLMTKRPTYRLFGSDGDAHQPFDSGQAFSQSFFNLFNYDCGLLNPHVDRSLLTVIRVQSGQNKQNSQSTLWVEGPDAVWRNADAEVGDDEVVIMIGEDSEQMPCVQNLGMTAAQHAVRVDPCGEYVSHSHFRPDPDTPPEKNRRSAAFILRHEPEA